MESSREGRGRMTPSSYEREDKSTALSATPLLPIPSELPLSHMGLALL